MSVGCIYIKLIVIFFNHCKDSVAINYRTFYFLKTKTKEICFVMRVQDFALKNKWLQTNKIFQILYKIPCKDYFFIISNVLNIKYYEIDYIKHLVSSFFYISEMFENFLKDHG